jgi:hypothetical protein
MGLLRAARAAWLLSQDETELRTVSRIKSNVSESKTGFSFRIIDRQVCDFDYEVDVVANDILQEAKDARAAKKGKSAKAMHAAADWLCEFLWDGEKPAGNEKNPVPGTVLYESKAAGHAWTTLRRAAKSLKIHKDDGKDGLSYWSLPDERSLVVQNAPSISPQQSEQADGSTITEPLDIACSLVQGEVVQEEVEQANELGMPMEATPLSKVVDRASELHTDDGDTSKNDDSVLGDAGSVFTPPPVIKMESHSELAADHVSILAVPFRNPRGGGAYKELKYSAAEFRGKVISACDIKELYLETIRELWAENRICVIAAIGRMNGGQLISKSPGKKSVPLDGGYYLNTSMWHCYFLQCLRSLLTEMNLASELFVRYAV